VAATLDRIDPAYQQYLSLIHCDRQTPKSKILQLATQRIRELEAQPQQDPPKWDRQPGVPRVGFVGYTNVGKSALINALFRSSALVSKDRLFETLTLTAREARLSSGFKMVVVDTIGFISDLPH
jgi:50S ribosomal subunit-associated GTPase HflX